MTKPITWSYSSLALYQQCPKKYYHLKVVKDIKEPLSEAITFGNANSKHSAITKVRLDNPNRSFYVLEQLHVLPGVTYLAKVRNTEAKHEGAKHEGAKHEEKKA